MSANNPQTQLQPSAANAHPTAAERTATLRRSLRLVMLAWVFGAAWVYMTTGATLTRYAQLLQLPKFGFGLLAAMPFAAALFQLPASYFLERFGFRKRFFLLFNIVHRLLWVAVAAVPWVIPDAWWWPGLLVLFGVSSILGQLATPAWVSWMADLVPSRMRGRYFSRRIQLGQLVGLCITVAIGYMLDRANLVGPEMLLKTISVALVAASILGTIDICCFFGVTDPPLKIDPHLSVWDLIRQPLADRSFRRFLAFTATLTLGTGFVGQFCWLYVFEVVGMSNMRANVMLLVMPLLVNMVAYPFWGRLIDRLGRKPVLIISGLLIVHGGASWIFVTPLNWVWGYLGVIIATAAWPGVELGTFNFILGMTQSRSGRRLRSAYIAVNSVVSATAGILSGLLGGALAEAMGDWSGVLLGWPLTYHGVLFIISGALRLAALGWLFGLEDTRAYTTRAALRYMGTSIYSNLQQAVFVPGRLLLQLSRWTYEIKPRKQKK
jgi:MFS family permease